MQPSSIRDSSCPSDTRKVVYGTIVPSSASATVVLRPSPVDTAIWWVFFYQGFGLLYPWNAFINASPFFKAKLGHIHGDFIANNIAMCFQFSQLLFLLASLIYRLENKLSLWQRLFLPPLIQLGVFSGLLGLVYLPGNLLFFRTCIFLATLAGATLGMNQSGMFSLCGLMPQDYTNALMQGQAMGGTLIAIFYVILLHSLESNDTLAFMYFGTSCAVLIVQCALCGWLLRQPIVVQSILDGKNQESIKTSLIDIAFQIGRILPGAGFTYAVSLAVFPGLADTIHSSSNLLAGPWDLYQPDSMFIGLVIFLTYNSADWCGRVIVGRWPNLISGEGLWVFIAARFLFVPLFLLCNIPYEPRTDMGSLPSPVGEGYTHGGLSLGYRWMHPPTRHPWFEVFDTDFWPFFFMIGLGVTNGICGTISMMIGPKHVLAQEKQAAGALMLTVVVVGINIGCLSSFFLKSYATGSLLF